MSAVPPTVIAVILPVESTDAVAVLFVAPDNVMVGKSLALYPDPPSSTVILATSPAVIIAVPYACDPTPKRPGEFASVSVNNTGTVLVTHPAVDELYFFITTFIPAFGDVVLTQTSYLFGLAGTLVCGFTYTFVDA